MTRRLVFALVIIIIGIGVFFSLTRLDSQTAPTYNADVVSALSGGDTAGYARAYQVRDFSFPLDYGAHPDYQTEWWYYTGNLATADGRRFGFEFTIFRRALTPTLPERESDWATNQLYFADLAVSDIGNNQFYSKQRFSRGAAGLAGAVTDPKVHIWIENWDMSAQDVNAQTIHLSASEDPVSIDFTTQQTKPPTLEGDRGLSAKSPDPGNASYYYSLTRLLTDGTITINGTAYKVSGTAWMDHEFSTSVLSKDAVGWDWFALQLDDKREIMLYHIRKKDGSIESTSDGTLVNADGTYTHLSKEDYTIDVLATWTSPQTGAVYPAKWRVTIKTADKPLVLDIMPLMANQELTATTAYWEGASRITSDDPSITGYGYVELTGYAPAKPSNSTTINEQPR